MDNGLDTYEFVGLSLIGCQFGKPGSTFFRAVNPRTDEELDGLFYHPSLEELNKACFLAEEAFEIYRNLPYSKRVRFLDQIAANIMSVSDVLIERYILETGLSRDRALSERDRTIKQIRLFMLEIEKMGNPSELRVKSNESSVDIRSRYTGLGPIAVFGPANFPMAYGVSGGDVMSALAAGCPVIVKAHPSHLGVCEILGRAIADAVKSQEIPGGVFSMIYDSSTQLGSELVTHPAIRAVAFTGSEVGGRTLYQLASQRDVPIPMFAEMSSLNPVVIFHKKLKEAGAELAKKYYESLTLGVGQFCVNPGLVLLSESVEADNFIEDLGRMLDQHTAEPMLNKRMSENYRHGLHILAKTDAVKTISNKEENVGPAFVNPALFQTTAVHFLENLQLHHEIFGPVAIAVFCKNQEDIRKVIGSLGGQLTISFHGFEEELLSEISLIRWAETRAGRLIMNGFPTGVEVCENMVHSGPFPATTDSRFTAVGPRSIYRFLRPVCYQGFYSGLLPLQ